MAEKKYCRACSCELSEGEKIENEIYCKDCKWVLDAQEQVEEDEEEIKDYPPGCGDCSEEP